MNQEENERADEAAVLKSAGVSGMEVSEEDLRKINHYALRPLKSEEVFAFKVAACDNGADDRNYEPFNLAALKDLKKLYVGKTMIKDHMRRADNQVARVFDAELIEGGSTKTSVEGETFTTLQLKAYMVRTESNKDLIAEIEAGIKKEVSTGCIPKHAYCNICGTDNRKTYCPHWHGREYDTKTGKKVCHFLLDGAEEALELSFVPVPAQPRAGTRKTYGAPQKAEEEAKECEKEQQEQNMRAEARLRLANAKQKAWDNEMAEGPQKGEGKNE